MHANKKLFMLRISLIFLLIILSLYYAGVEDKIFPYNSLDKVLANLSAYNGREVSFTGKVVAVEQKDKGKLLRVSTMLEDGIKFKHAEFEAVLKDNIVAMPGDSIDAVAIVEDGKLEIKRAIFYRERNQKLIYLTSFSALIIAFIIFIDAIFERR